jgi:hypothetical protein
MNAEDKKFLELLKDFQKAHLTLTNFFIDQDNASEYSHLAPQFYPFNYSFDEYVKGIDQWVKACTEALEHTGNSAKAKRFCFDESKTFNGYTFGSLWNGWECPYFEFDVAMEIAKWNNKGGVFMASYDPEKDEFYFYDEGGDYTDVYKGMTIETEHGQKKVYDLGYNSWCWLDADAWYK